MNHFEEAMKKIRPLSTQELDIYKRIANEFGKPEFREKVQKKHREQRDTSSRNYNDDI